MATTEPTLIPNRWLSVSRYVGPRLEHCRYRGRAISLSLRLRGCVAGCTTNVRGQVRTEPDRPKPTAKGMCGNPLHKICTASLDNLPLIDGFVRVTDTIREPIKSAINSAIRQGLLGMRGR